MVHTRFAPTWALGLAVAALAAGAAAADEIDDLAAKVKPPERFKDYKADFRVEEREFTFRHAGGKVEQKRWRVVRDGERYVALVRSGDIILLALAPEQARTSLEMPTGRYHLDTMQGPSLPTWQFLQPVKVHGAIYGEEGGVVQPQDRWEGGGGTLTLVREVKGDDRQVEHRFTLRVDPVFGYRIDGRYHVALKELPEDKQRKFASGAFCPGCYTVWPETAVYDRTVLTPEGVEGFHGYANNLLCMDRFDGDRKRTTWRKNGFIGYLDAKSGWSVVRTRDSSGGVPQMPICNAHNDFHISIPLDETYARAEDGYYHLEFHHRLMALPPEMTRYIWDNMKMPPMGGPAVFIRFGRVEDFEDQPIPLDRPTRGLCWTSGGPALSSAEARSGTKSLLLTGTSWPNLPQVSLLPDTKYRLEAWFKVEGDPGARAYVKADYYEWTPHNKERILLQQTSPVEAGKGWQRSVLEFTTPEWDPFLDIVFVVEGGAKAWMDDFSLMKVETQE